MDTNNEILDAIEILAGKKISENITKVLTGVCKSVNINNNTCVMDSNGVSSTVQFYGSPPEVNELYRIFVPSNDMSRSFIIVPPRFTVNPNLLDNWYFGNPVDQRGGKIIQQGKMAYRDAECTIEAGGVSETAMAVTKVSDTVYTFKGGDGNPYYVKAADVVRGYVPAWDGYSIDRWAVESDSEIVITFVDGGIHVRNTSSSRRQFKQILPSELNLAGRMITISVLVGDMTGMVNYALTQTDNPYTNSAVCTITTGGLFGASGSVLTGQQKIAFVLEPGAEITILAAKLELGPTQTLAHQDAAGNWVLNEVPEYGEQLARCQRYFVRYTFDTQRFIGVLNIDNANGGQGYINLPVSMRATPTISGPIGFYSADNNVSVNINVLGSKGGLIWVNASTATPLANAPKMGLLYAQATLDISADL